MTENQTAKYVKFWFCMMFSALSFSWDNRQHFRSGNNISVEVDFVVCFLSEFKDWYVDREWNDKNPTARCEKFWFRASLLINFGRASVVVPVAPNKLCCVANYASFSELVLFQLKKIYLQNFKKI